jgi:hypothetical protein
MNHYTHLHSIKQTRQKRAINIESSDILRLVWLFLATLSGNAPLWLVKIVVYSTKKISHRTSSTNQCSPSDVEEWGQFVDLSDEVPPTLVSSSYLP